MFWEIAAPPFSVLVRRPSPMTVPASESAVPSYLTPAEVAELLRVSVKSVYRWLGQDPSMPVLKIGGTVRFPRERLERWLRAREQGPARPQRIRRQEHSAPKSPSPNGFALSRERMGHSLGQSPPASARPGAPSR